MSRPQRTSGSRSAPPGRRCRRRGRTAGLSTRSNRSTSQPRSRSISPGQEAAHRAADHQRAPRHRPAATSMCLPFRHAPACIPGPTALPLAGKSVIYDASHHWRNAMAMSMTDKSATHSEKTEWPESAAAGVRTRGAEQQPLRRQRAGVGKRPRAGMDHPPQAGPAHRPSTATCSTISGPRCRAGAAAST